MLSSEQAFWDGLGRMFSPYPYRAVHRGRGKTSVPTRPIPVRRVSRVARVAAARAWREAGPFSRVGVCGAAEPPCKTLSDFFAGGL